MKSQSFKLEEIIFESNTGGNDCFLESVVCLLFGCSEFRKTFSQFIEIYHECNPKCISCILADIYNSAMASKTLDVFYLRRKLSTVFREKNLFQQNHKSDAMECLNAILNALHCKYLGDTSEGTNESALNEKCRSLCVAHSLFSLGVVELYQCECNSKSQTEWDYSNYCQYFNIADILSQTNSKNSNNLLIVPIIKLKSYTNEANCDLKGQMMPSLQLKLQTAEADCCPRDNCKRKKSKISFSLQKPPSIYLVNIIWESDEVGHLDSFIAAISITESITMKEIYGNSTSDIYNLRGILFYKKSHYEYALRTDDFWAFKGLGEECGWFELLKEITIMNYHPICLVYEKNLISYNFKISHAELLELEKLACECDHYENKISETFYNDFPDDCTGLFNTRKGKSLYNPVPESPIIPKTTQKDSSEFQYQSKKLENLEKVRIPEEHKLYQDIEKEPIYASETKNPLLEGEIKQTSYIPETRNPFFEGKTNQPNDNIIEKPSNIETDEKKNQKSWKCPCGSENLDDWEVCVKCQKLKPGLQGWVCKFCTTINDYSVERCVSCFSYKLYDINSQSEYWKCSKCNSFNTGSRIQCSQCENQMHQDKKPQNKTQSRYQYPGNSFSKPK